jgi:hypothetical protein
MDNVLRSTQQLHRFWTKQPMRIGNYPNPHQRLSCIDRRRKGIQNCFSFAALAVNRFG